jgi:hypothetical protein
MPRYSIQPAIINIRGKNPAIINIGSSRGEPIINKNTYSYRLMCEN